MKRSSPHQKIVEALGAGNWAEAEQHCRETLADQPEDFYANYLLGSALLRQTRYDDALAALEVAQKIKSDDKNVLSLKGLTLRGLARPEDALEAFQAALANNPDDPQLWNNHGATLLELRQPEEALASFTKAFTLDPRNALAFYNQGVALERMELPIRALGCFDRALMLDRAYANPWEGKGRVLQNLGRLEEALACFNKAIEIQPNHHIAWNNRGTLLKKAGRLEDALYSFEKAILLQPNYYAAHYNRGLVLADLGRHGDAMEALDRTISLQPNHAQAWNAKGAVLQAMKRYEEGLASSDRAVALEPDYAEAWHDRGNALQNLRRADEAVHSYERAVSLDPDYAEAWNDRGVALQSQKHFEAAIASYQTATRLKPAYREAHYNLGSALCESHRIAEGFAVFRNSAQLFPDVNSQRSAEPHKLRHDAEQREYLATKGKEARDLSVGARLEGPAINSANAGPELARQWRENAPAIVVIDDFLSQEALLKLRDFCWAAKVWRRAYDDGYLGAFAEEGFACPLLAQIADELRLTFPAIFADHPLRYFWGFKYDSRHRGIRLHADKAAINVNFWITPDEANLDRDSGGLVIWDKAAPMDWDFIKYNGDEKAARDFLVSAGAKSRKIPYRANRAVIFDSDLFHETDQISFKEGYENRRINVTLLYGRRGSDDW